jgi:hypothetical protein
MSQRMAQSPYPEDTLDTLHEFDPKKFADDF